MANTENCPKVGIVMGSDSDMPVMAKAADILEELGIPYEMTVISAHREPDVFFEYAKSAELSKTALLKSSVTITRQNGLLISLQTARTRAKNHVIAHAVTQEQITSAFRQQVNIHTATGRHSGQQPAQKKENV